MSDLPQIVRERLQAAKPTVSHPDADLLTAFTQQSLPPTERVRIFEHLARCGDCRDVIALALPENETVEIGQLVASSGSHSRFWPVLRWGMVFAGAAIAIIGVLRYEDSGPNMMTASNAPVPGQTLPETKLAPAAKSRSETSATQTASNLPPSLSREQAIPARAKAPAGYTVGYTKDKNGALSPVRIPKANLATPDSSQDLPSVADVDKTARGGADARNENQLQAQNDLPAHPQLFNNSDRNDFAKVSKAKPASPGNTESSAASALAPPAVPLQTRPSLLQDFRPPVPQWRIQSTGSLQRSFDGGKNWQDIVVTDRASPAENSKQGEAPSQQASNAYAEKKTTQPATDPVFEAVATIFPEVWAGGSAGILYHSTDEGEHWTRVVPSTSGIFLTGDITRLEFSDLRHGTIATSSPEIWMTADGGQSWQKQ